MTDFKNVLFPIDLSETSAKIVPHVRYVAEKFQAKVHMLFVVRDLEYYSGFYVPHPSIDVFAQELTSGSKKKLTEFKNEHMEDMPDTEYSVLLGDPAEEILKYVKEHGIDLIVMGTHGRKGLDRLFFGSVAEKVVKLSPVPVLTINPYTL